jgi:hypothetical protein
MLETSLDTEEYNTDDLITIKVPLSMPYVNSWSEFQRVNGEIEVAGRVYKFVKRKIYEGQLILLCLPDDQKTHLKAAGDDFFKSVNDLSATSSSKKQGNTASFKNIQGDYDDQCPGWLSCTLESQVEYPWPADQARWPSPSYAIPGQPPEPRTA